METSTLNKAVVAIQSHDYGTWGKLKARVGVDGIWYECKTENGDDYITVPFDEDEDPKPSGGYCFRPCTLAIYLLPSDRP
jgi:hypothetical protein